MNRVLLSVLALTAGLSQCALAALNNQHWIIRTDPVIVEADLVEAEEEDSEHLGHYSFDIIVNRGPSEAHIETMIIAVQNLSEAIQVLKETTAWVPPYLFVRSDCGGSNAWACEREVVFRLLKGRLIRLGEFAIGDDREPAASFKGGVFFDIYDKLEQKVGGLSHAFSPLFRLVLVESDNRLEVDAWSTWLENATTWASNLRIAASRNANFSDLDVFSAVVECATLAKYCNRKTELRQILRLSDRRLSRAQRADLREALSLVVPLELPERWRK